MKKRLILTAILTILFVGVLPMESKADSWVSTGSGWRYRTDNGDYVADEWKNINNQWYSFSPAAIMRTGWFQDRDSKWYYFNIPNGNMQTGWVYVDGSWYYLDAANGGAMASNTNVEGKYYVDASGRWVDNQAAGSNNELISEYEREVVRLVNIERNNRGLSSLSISDKLSKAADVRAAELVDKFDHERPNGSRASTAAKEAGYNYTAFGENIAAGYPSPKYVVEGWMNSEGHRNNILNSGYTEIGVGYFEKSGSKYEAHWVQLFGTPK